MQQKIKVILSFILLIVLLFSIYAVNNIGISKTTLTYTNIPTDINTFQVTADLPTNWWNDEWKYRKLITIKSSTVDTDLINFPILVNIVDIDLKNKVQANACDIVFADETGNIFNYEIEAFNKDTGQLIAWIKIPVLSSMFDTQFYMYYGNPLCSLNNNPDAVWNNNYIMVNHFKDETSPVSDSTSNQNNGLIQGNALFNSTAKINGGYDFHGNTLDGDNDRIDLGENMLVSHLPQYTISAWFKSSGESTELIYGEVNTQASSFLLLYVQEESLRVSIMSTGTMEIIVPMSIHDGKWHYVTFVKRSSSDYELFHNGQSIGVGTDTVTVQNINTVSIGSIQSFGSYYNFKGTIDEVRLSSIARSSEWIHANYRTMNIPSPENLAANPRADVDRNGIVEGLDIAVIRNSANWNRPVDQAANPLTDVNEDGMVDQVDIDLVRDASNWLREVNTVMVFNTEESIDEEVLIPLIISAPITALEGSTVIITITANNQPVEFAEMTFNGNVFHSDNQGVINLDVPLVHENTLYSITATKSGFLPASPIEINILNKQLAIHIDPVITEYSTFSLYITEIYSKERVPNIFVTFNHITQQTDENGFIQFTAPEVNSHTSYTITANHNDFAPATVTITIWNKIEDIPKGYVYGYIYDSTGKPLSGVSVRIILSTSEMIKKTTGDDGLYVLSAPVGIYNLELSKNGFQTDYKNNIEIEYNKAIEYTINLKELESIPQTHTDGTEALVESTLQNAIDTGTIGASLVVTNKENEPTAQIEYYSDEFKINIKNIHKESEIVQFTLSADTEVSGSFFIVYLENNLVSDVESLQIRYDEISDLQKLSIQDFLVPEERHEPGYITLPTKNGIYIILFIPHFSVHTITIFSTVTSIGLFIGLVLFIFLCGIAFLVFFSPFYIRYLSQFQRNKKIKR